MPRRPLPIIPSLSDNAYSTMFMVVSSYNPIPEELRSSVTSVRVPPYSVGFEYTLDRSDMNLERTLPPNGEIFIFTPLFSDFTYSAQVLGSSSPFTDTGFYRIKITHCETRSQITQEAKTHRVPKTLPKEIDDFMVLD